MRAVSHSCDTGICPSQVLSNDACPSAGSFIPCSDTAIACEDGCRTCRDDLTWGECKGSGCDLGTANSTASCDDGIFCNGADYCSAGACIHAGDPCLGGSECADSCDEIDDDCFADEGLPCIADGNSCTDDVCDGAGVCVPSNNTTACSDGDLCTSSDTCSGGSCSGNPDSGDPHDPCVIPFLLSASELDSTTVRVRYSQDMDISATGSGAANVSNYCVENLDGNPGGCLPTADFTLVSAVAVDPRTIDITVSATILASAYTAFATGIVDAKGTALGVPEYADLAGQGSFRLLSGEALTARTVRLVFSKPAHSSPDTAGSADCTSAVECNQRYKLSGPTALGRILSATVQQPPQDDVVVLAHAAVQGGGVYSAVVANAADDDGFDDTGWGAIQNSAQSDSVGTVPNDRTSFAGLGAPISTFDDGPLLVDPFSDGALFSYIFAHSGKLYLGPNRSGSGAVRTNGDGSAAESITFRFFEDTNPAGGSTSLNASKPYSSIGSAACVAEDTPACGPDNENGRALFASGAVSEGEWLVVGGARSAGQLDYVYMTQDLDTSLDFKYVDISGNLGPQTKGFSAMGVVGDRVYLGFPDDGGNRPYVVSILNLPTAASAGMDTSQNGTTGAACVPLTHDACYLDGVGMPDIGNGGGNSAHTIIIDFIVGYNAMVYLGNNGGLVRSTTTLPLDYRNNTGDWTAITPSAAAYSTKTSVSTRKTAEIEPADRAWVQPAVHNGLMYIARNTSDGPQLWRCDPNIQSAPAPATAADCDSGDWTLIAANRVGDTLLSQFDNENNTSAGFLSVNGSYLYVGFNNAIDGVVVYRTNAATINAATDFEGSSSCTPPCAGVGGNGLGDSAAHTQFYNAVSLRFGLTDYLYVATGNGAGSVSIHRTQN